MAVLELNFALLCYLAAMGKVFFSVGPFSRLGMADILSNIAN